MRYLVIMGRWEYKQDWLITLCQSLTIGKIIPRGSGPSTSEGRGVFIDFTAGWCINCQVNDRLVLQSPDVVKAFKDNRISAFKADWTNYDPAITRALYRLAATAFLFMSIIRREQYPHYFTTVDNA